MYATGAVAPTATRGDNPLPYERNNLTQVHPELHNAINKIKQFVEQKRQQGQFNPWNRPGQPTPFPSPTTQKTWTDLAYNPAMKANENPMSLADQQKYYSQLPPMKSNTTLGLGQTATIGNPNQGGYNPKPSQSNLNILDSKGNVVGVRDVFPGQTTTIPPQVSPAPTGASKDVTSPTLRPAMDPIGTDAYGNPVFDPMKAVYGFTYNGFVPYPASYPPDPSKKPAGGLNNEKEILKQNYVYPKVSVNDIKPGGQYYDIDKQGVKTNLPQTTYDKDTIKTGNKEVEENESLEKEFKKKQLGLDNDKPQNKKLNNWSQKWSDHYDKHLATRI
jgi:hypothetical protein